MPSPDDYPPPLARLDIDGVKVVSDVVMESPLSKHSDGFVPVTGIRVLTLEDGTQRLACSDCVFVAAADRDGQEQTPLGQVRTHRSRKHGVDLGGNRRGRRPVEEPAGDGDTAGTVVLPRDTLSMSLLDILNLAGHIDQWAAVLSGLEDANARLAEENTQLRIRVRAAEKERDDVQKAADRKVAGMQRKIARAMGLSIVTTEDKEEQ